MGCSHSSLNNIFQINVCITPAFSDELGGKIELKCIEHIKCEWRKDDNAALLQLSSDRMTAYNVPPGIYEILCTSKDASQIISVTVEKIDLVMIDEYIVTHASNDNARDGIIEAKISNLNSNHGVYKFLWTSGVVTEEPILHDVRPGTYYVNVISDDKTPISFYHGCCPAIVNVKMENCLIHPS